MEKLTKLVRRRRRLFLNISKGFTIGNAAIPNSAISVRMSMRKRMRLNSLSTNIGKIKQCSRRNEQLLSASPARGLRGGADQKYARQDQRSSQQALRTK